MSRGWVLAARIAFIGCLVGISWVSLLPPEQLPAGPALSDKVVHAGGYAILAALAVASGLRAAPAVALVVAIGLLLEVAQRASGYRSFEWLDLAADAAGASVGAVLMSVIVQRRRGRAPRASS